MSVNEIQALTQKFADAFDQRDCGFINEFRIECFAFSELFTEEITSVLAALVSVGSYECGEASYKRAHHCRKSTDPSTVHTINLTGQGCLGALSIKGLSMQSSFPFLQR